MTKAGDLLVPTMRPIRIVIADDHALMCDGLAAILQPPHEVAAIVHDGRDVLHTVSELRPDMLLLDISLPGQNGLTVLREIRIALGDEVRVLMLTMHSEHAYSDEALGAGADGYLLKSSGAAELRFAVAEAMSGRCYVTPLLRPAELRFDDGTHAALVSRMARPRAMIATLTRRQREVLKLMAHGHSTAEIGARLGISAKTVEFHRHAIREQLGLTSQASLVRFAVAAGLVAA